MMGNTRWKGWVVNAGVVGVARGQMLGELPAVVTRHMTFRPQASTASSLPRCLNPLGTSQLEHFRAIEDIRIPTERYTGLGLTWLSLEGILPPRTHLNETKPI
jgi:hypothetical protein